MIDPEGNLLANTDKDHPYVTHNINLDLVCLFFPSSLSFFHKVLIENFRLWPLNQLTQGT